MDIAERIKQLREAYDITSNDLAQITGIHPVSIRKYETNKMVPGIEVIDMMCEALKLPRMIFEGIPKQYTDYSFAGDFYQLLFLLLANGTLTLNDPHKAGLTAKPSFVINPDLAKYIQVKAGDSIIPLENITIHPCVDRNNINKTLYKLSIYLGLLEKADSALKAKKWNSKETKEEYAARLLERAEQIQLSLMLEGHSWKQHMSGFNDSDQTMEELNEFILRGGNFYDFVAQADLPETMKKKYIESYEDAYVSEIVESGNDPYPGDASKKVKDAWIESIQDQIEQYKIDHPDYKEQAKQHAIENAQKIRDAAQ